MPQRRWTRRAALAAGALAGLMALGACSPIPMVLDTPKDGDPAVLTLNQGLTVRWGNLWPAAGSWTVADTGGPTVLEAKGHQVQPPANGAQQLETFDFTAVRKGKQELTFIFQHKNGEAPRADERVRIAVTVS